MENENDFYLSDAAYPLCIIADGGQHWEVVENAASLAINTVVSCFKEKKPSSKNEIQLLRDAIQEVNKGFRELFQDRHGCAVATIAGSFADGGIYLAHLGNCRAYLFTNADLTQKTQDHTLFNYYLKKGKVSKNDLEDFLTKEYLRNHSEWRAK